MKIAPQEKSKAIHKLSRYYYKAPSDIGLRESVFEYLFEQGIIDKQKRDARYVYKLKKEFDNYRR